MIKKNFQKKNKKTVWKIKNSNLNNFENIEREIKKSKRREKRNNHNVVKDKKVQKNNIFNDKKENFYYVDSEYLNKEKTLKKLIHKPVMLSEVIKSLELREGERVFDGTLGQGSYSEEILKKIKKKGTLIGTDLDLNALEFSKRRLKKYLSNKIFFQRNFSEIDKILKEIEIKKIDKAVLDLGFGSHQLDNSSRGISFLKGDEPLNMNLSTTFKEDNRTASDILNYWKEEDLADIFSAFGGEKHAKLVARKIVEERVERKFEIVNDLTKLLIGVLSPFYKKQKIHPATRVFQALRIVVNDELESLKEALENIFDNLANDGIVTVVTFHSLEDKIVKKYFRKLEDDGLAQRINKKVVIPSKYELNDNSRARSAKMRSLKKTPLIKNKYKN